MSHAAKDNDYIRAFCRRVRSRRIRSRSTTCRICETNEVFWARVGRVVAQKQQRTTHERIEAILEWRDGHITQCTIAVHTPPEPYTDLDSVLAGGRPQGNRGHRSKQR